MNLETRVMKTRLWVFHATVTHIHAQMSYERGKPASIIIEKKQRNKPELYD